MHRFARPDAIVATSGTKYWQAYGVATHSQYCIAITRINVTSLWLMQVEKVAMRETHRFRLTVADDIRMEQDYTNRCNLVTRKRALVTNSLQILTELFNIYLMKNNIKHCLKDLSKDFVHAWLILYHFIFSLHLYMAFV